MGFPQRSTEDQAGAVHVGADVRLMAAGYTCPRCKVWALGVWGANGARASQSGQEDFAPQRLLMAAGAPWGA
eukprot:296803-Chlamydomonas_euryale.AAC.2